MKTTITSYMVSQHHVADVSSSGTQNKYNKMDAVGNIQHGARKVNIIFHITCVQASITHLARVGRYVARTQRARQWSAQNAMRVSKKENVETGFCM